MSEQNKPKQYGNKDIIRNLIFAIVLIMLILFCFYTIFTGYFRMSFGKYLFFSFLSAVGLYWCLRKLYYYYANCLYVDTTDENILGINIYKKKRGELKFNEIKEVKIRKKSGINLKDIHGNQLTILYRDGFIPLVNEILEKSENCTKTFIDYSIRRKLYEFSDIKTIKTRLHESDIKPHESDIRPQKPKQYGSIDPSAQNSTIKLILFIIFCFYIIFTDYSSMSFGKYLFFSLLYAAGIYWCSRIIYRYFVYCSYVETTEEEILGWNAYGRKKGAIKFNEIKGISVKKRSGIHLKDIHGNKLAIPYGDEFIPLLKEILEKSENCTKTFMEYSIKYKLYKLPDKKSQKSDIKTHKSNTKPLKSKPNKPEDIKGQWAIIILIIIINSYFISIAYWQESFKAYLYLVFVSAGVIYYCSLSLYYNYAYCVYVETTDEEIKGKSRFKVNDKVIKFNELKEILSELKEIVSGVKDAGIAKVIFLIHLKDIHGNRLSINFREGFVPVLKTILEKSENCTMIDIDYDYLINQNYSQLSDIQPILDKRLAELKEKDKRDKFLIS